MPIEDALTITTQHPELVGSELALLGQGDDHEVWKATPPHGPDRAIRIALKDTLYPSTFGEHALLTEVGPKLSLPVPDVEHVGSKPRPHLVYPVVPGAPGDPQDPASVGSQLGAFLNELHRTNFYVAVSCCGAPSSAYGVSQAWENARRHLTAWWELPKDVSKKLRKGLGNRPKDYQDPFRLIHGDLVREHVLLDGPEIMGVIDWSNATLGDPACDFTGVTRWLGVEGLDAALEPYSMIRDRAFRRRILRWSLADAVSDRQLDVALELAGEILSSR